MIFLKKSKIARLNSRYEDKRILVGTKARNLIKLKRRRVLVPDGFCITSEASKMCFGLLKPEISNREGALTEERLFSSIRIPVDLEEEIAQAYEVLIKKHGDSVNVAVRSSSEFEDLSDSSYAGQYETVLEVVDFQGLLSAIKKCWVSAFSERVARYQERFKIKNDPNFIAVIVQVMVKPDFAGVLFTVDPLTREKNQMVVEFTSGLGDAVVSAAKMNSRLRMDRRSPNILKFDNFDQDMDETAVREIKWSELFQISLKIEKIFKAPQDIEWAYADGKFWILQSRPVNFNSRSVPREIWTRANAGEILPGVVTPLTWSIFKPILGKAGYFLGKSPLTLHWKWVHPYGKFPDSPRLFKGRAYMELTSVYTSFGSLPGITPEILQRILGFEYNLCLPHEIPQKRPRRHIMDIYRNFRFWMEIMGFSETLQHKAEKWMGNFSNQKSSKDIAGNQKAEDLLRDIELLSNEAARVLALHIQCTSMAFSSLGLLDSLVGKYIDPEELGKFEAGLIADFAGITTVQQSLAIWDLAQAAQQDSRIMKILLDEKVKGGLLEELGVFPEARDFISKWESFIMRFGQRSTQEFELAVPHWNEDHSLVVQTIREMIKSSISDPRGKLVSQKNKSEENSRSIEATIEHRKAAMDLFKFRRLLKVYKKFVLFRENLKYCVVDRFNSLRVDFLDLGNLLKNEGLISDREDIFFLQYDELKRLLRAKTEKEFDSKQIVYLRKQESREYANTHCEDVLLYQDGSLMAAVLPNQKDLSVLQGIGCSLGQFTAPAYVLDSVLEDTKVPTGHILVAPSIDPGLTILFLTVSGLVTEIGGLLSHGATVAREYGLPAVVGVANATKIIKTGQRITVDGGTGKVYLFPEGN